MIMRRLFLILSLLGVSLVSYAQVDSLSGPVSRLDSAVIVSESAKQRLLQSAISASENRSRPIGGWNRGCLYPFP
jgi:hypothetical protein